MTEESRVIRAIGLGSAPSPDASAASDSSGKLPPPPQPQETQEKPASAGQLAPEDLKTSISILVLKDFRRLAGSGPRAEPSSFRRTDQGTI